MSENGVTRLLLIIITFSSVRHGTPLECYVCNSVEDSECSSSLSGIERSTCYLDAIPETTLASTVSTTILDSVTTTKTTTNVPTSMTHATSTEDSSTNVVSTPDSVITTTNIVDSTSPITITITTEDSLTEISSITTIEDTNSATTSTGTEDRTATVTSGDTTTLETTSSTVGETSTIDNATLTDVKIGRFLDLEKNKPEVRVVRNADVAFACYTLTLILNNETVTDRGCVVESSSMCETLNEEKYPNHNLTTCETCTKDGCNSSPIVLSEISSLFLPFIMFFLSR